MLQLCSRAETTGRVSANSRSNKMCTFVSYQHFYITCHLTFTVSVYELAFMSGVGPDVSGVTAQLPSKRPMFKTEFQHL